MLLSYIELLTQQGNQNEEEDDVYQTPTYQDEWMQLCQLNPTFRDDHIPESDIESVDWESAANELDHSLLRSCPNWFQMNRAQATNEVCAPTRLLDISTLNHAQRKAYDIIANHFLHQQPNTPVRMLILGTAGTGKSF